VVNEPQTSVVLRHRTSRDHIRLRVVSRAVSLLTTLVLVALLGLAAPDLCAAQSVSASEREALVRLRVDQGGRAEDVDALIRLADEAAAKGLPAGPLTNKSVPEHRLVGVSCG
jgi:hypothetical protein